MMPTTPNEEMRHEFPIPFVTRKTPVLLTMQIVFLLFASELVYVAMRIVGAQSGNESLSSVWVFLVFLLAQAIAVGVLYARWFVETYRIHRDDVHHHAGILFRKEETFPYNNIQTITCKQSVLGRIYHYGDVSFFIPTLGHELTFTHVPHPHHFIHTIRHVMPYPDKSKFIVHGA